MLGQNIDEQQLRDGARELFQLFGCPILLKGGHKQGNPEDTLYDGTSMFHWKHTRVQNINSHGTGCILSASITAQLAKGSTLYDAVDIALQSVQYALRNPITLMSSLSLAGIEHCG